MSEVRITNQNLTPKRLGAQFTDLPLVRLVVWEGTPRVITDIFEGTPRQAIVFFNKTRAKWSAQGIEEVEVRDASA